MISRRRFLALSSLALLSGGLVCIGCGQGSAQDTSDSPGTVDSVTEKAVVAVGATLGAAQQATPMSTLAPSDTEMPTAIAQPTEVEMVVDCPFGRINDEYPGRCRRYVDKNDNGICDLSEPHPA